MGLCYLQLLQWMSKKRKFDSFSILFQFFSNSLDSFRVRRLYHPCERNRGPIRTASDPREKPVQKWSSKKGRVSKLYPQVVIVFSRILSWRERGVKWERSERKRNSLFFSALSSLALSGLACVRLNCVHSAWAWCASTVGREESGSSSLTWSCYVQPSELTLVSKQYSENDGLAPNGVLQSQNSFALLWFLDGLCYPCDGECRKRTLLRARALNGRRNVVGCWPSVVSV